MRKTILAIALCYVALVNSAQTKDEKWNVGAHAGFDQYNGDLGNGWYSTHQAFYGLGGVSVSRYLNDRVDAFFLGTYGELGYMGPYNSVTDRPSDNNFRIRLGTANFLLRYHLLSRESIVAPYIFGGVSALNQRDRSLVTVPRKKNIDFAFPTAGAGLIFRLGPIISLQVQEMFMYTWADDVDRRVNGLNDMYLMHTIGLTINIWKPADKPMGSRAGARIAKCDEQCKNPKRDKGHKSRTKAKLRGKNN